MWNIEKKKHLGTSIGFKNIASKIAYDLRLWLNSKPEQYPSQQSKSLDTDDREQYNIVEEDDEDDDDATNTATVTETSNNGDGTSSSTVKSSSNRRNTTSSSKSSGNRNSNIKLGYNNIIASLLRTTTL